MAQKDFMYKIRQWDNRASQWMGRHFYVILFQVILAIIFLLAFINVLKIINIGFNIHKDDVYQQMMFAQSINTILIVALLILIALGILNIINGNLRLRGILKNIEFNLTKRRSDQKNPPPED